MWLETHDFAVFVISPLIAQLFCPADLMGGLIVRSRCKLNTEDTLGINVVCIFSIKLYWSTLNQDCDV